MTIFVQLRSKCDIYVTPPTVYVVGGNTIYAPIYATVPRESPVMTSFQDTPHSEKMAENNTQKVVQFEYLPAPPILPSDHALYKTETFKEKLFRKAKQNPFIPVGKSTDLCY